MQYGINYLLTTWYLLYAQLKICIYEKRPPPTVIGMETCRRDCKSCQLPGYKRLALLEGCWPLYCCQKWKGETQGSQILLSLGFPDQPCEGTTLVQEPHARGDPGRSTSVVVCLWCGICRTVWEAGAAWWGNWEGATGKGPMSRRVLKLCLAVSACVGVGALLLHSVGVGSAAGR